ncbi:MAG: DNA-3-methyladenine glycosylase I [Desulfovibrio sp.]|nr:DNA-3-methyladenine glycosylase I [Desulfovibrio sp.]
MPQPEAAVPLPETLDPRPRCPWCLTGVRPDPVYVRYHDQEWGVPLHDDRALFELLVLEGAQAGLNWLMVLKKRHGYRQAFAGLDPAVVACYGEADLERLAQDARIIRNRQKIASAIGNARAFLAVAEAFGSFDAYLWGFVNGAPVQNAWSELRQVPARTPLSDAIAKDLQTRGFSFVGSTIIYALLQSAGLVNDHLSGCFRRRELGGR